MTENTLLTQHQVEDQPEMMRKKLLEELVGEDKKFKDTQALAKGKYQADLYVSILKEGWMNCGTTTLQFGR